jgi:hypothetical protein
MIIGAAHARASSAFTAFDGLNRTKGMLFRFKPCAASPWLFTAILCIMPIGYIFKTLSKAAAYGYNVTIK